MWKDLSIQQKSEVMKMAISQGLTDLNEIKRMYDASIPNIEASSVNNTYSSVPYNPSPKDVRYAYGGPLGNIYKGTGNKSQKLNIWTSGAWTADDLASELLRLGVRARVTSKGRSAKQQAKFNTPANRSWHVKNKAIDVVPTTNWDDLKADLLKPEVKALFNSAGIGVLDERPASVQKKTGATGAHFHIGPDRSARRGYAAWTSKDFASNNTPQIDYNSPIYDTSWQSMQWQPPIVASSRQEDIAPLLVQDNKPLILEPLEDTSPTPKDFSAIWDQIFPKVENTQEEFNPLLDPSTQFTALQSRPRYQMKPTPIINMPVSNGDNGYMLFKPLAKGGNLFDTGSYLRNYQWRNMPETDVVYNDYNTGLPIQVGSMVWTDENGNIVTADTPNAAADYAVQYGNPTFELNIPEITIEGLGDGKSKGLVGESFEDRYARLLAAPIATNADVDNAFKEQAQWQHEQSKEKHDMDVRAADRRAYQLTPGFGTFVAAPLAATLAPIAGYELGIAALSNPYFIESLPEAIDAGTSLARSLLGLGTAGEMGLLGYDFAKYGSDAFNPWLNQNRALFNTYKDFYVLPYDVAKAGLNIYKAKSDPELAARLMLETNVDPVNSIRGIANPGSVSDNFERVIYDNSISNDSIDYIKRGGIFGLGTPQDAFLLERNKQREEFLEHKWLEGTKGDYGLVSKAVGDRNLPVYQTRPDVISRKELVPLFDTYLHPFYSDDYARLPQAYQYPTAVYLGKNGRWYGKSWDLNDYGGSGGSTTGLAGTVADLIGNPTVVTTGFQEIPEDQIEELMHSAYYTVPNMKEILTSNGKQIDTGEEIPKKTKLKK